MNVLRVAGTATVVALGAFMFVMFRCDRRPRLRRAGALTRAGRPAHRTPAGITAKNSIAMRVLQNMERR